MTITDVRVRKVAKEGKMKAVVSITLDDEFVVHDIKVIEGEKGLFIAMPSRKAADGEYRDTVLKFYDMFKAGKSLSEITAEADKMLAKLVGTIM